MNGIFRRLAAPLILPSTLLIALISGMLWLVRKRLWAFQGAHPSARAGILLASTVLVGALILWVLFDDWLRSYTWRKRFNAIVGTQGETGLRSLPAVEQEEHDLIERAFGPVLMLRWAARLSSDWKAAEIGKFGSRYLLLLITLSAVGWFAGYRSGGVILSTALAFLFPFIMTALVRARAARKSQRFQEQLPQALDGIASGLSAGLSFHQAIAYTAHRLPAPANTVFYWIKVRLELGYSVEETLSTIRFHEQDEAFSLLIEGVLLQRQFGGDLIQMLQETASLIRERNELEREARSVTAQGRLSGIVIAGLVPVSAGLLLLFNPQYIDVLFNSTVGQVFIVAALALLLVGWSVISRLIRIRY